ncbi:hypothetical protein B7P43_G11440 [Cryptotermes secundus]|uniref:Mos1 transposase HTH domain-containing protein n=1 Tax=Cryptotermes secundus TaxID=105785 RepID=A0A2J7PEC0_9NEOP|nr:hypothetical protein B7P43_G11440 [Cryptotermes secundus]
MEAGIEEQRSIVRFLTAEGVGGRVIHCLMSVVYGEHSMSRSRVLVWHKRFREGRVPLQDDARTGQAHRVITPDVIAALGGHILANRRITVEEISLLMGISQCYVHAIVTKRLLYRKICAQWVPHQLTEEQKTQRMAASLGHLQRYHEEECVFLSRAATGNETWFHHFQPERKRQSQQWKHVNSPPPNKSKAGHTSSGKVMMTFFFDCKGPLLVEFLEHGATISAQRYEDTLQKLRRAIKSERPGMLSNGIILLHDNARPNTANCEQYATDIWLGGASTSPQQPRSLFGGLKRDIRGHLFASDEDVCGCVKMWFRRQPTGFFKDRIDRLSPSGINVLAVSEIIFEVRNVL